MSVYKPAKSKHWQFDYRWQGHRYHGSTGCASRRDAERFEAEHRRKVALGEKVKPAFTVEQACDEWFAAVGAHLASHATCLYQLGNIIAGLGRKTMMQDLTIRDLDRHIAKRRATVSNASVNREVTLLRRVTRWAEKRGYDMPSITWRDALLSESAERVRELSADEETRLFHALPDNLKPIVEFALLSGQRRSEIIALRWADVDLASARAKLWVKGGRHHTIPLSPRMVAIIANQPKVCPQVFTYVCTRRAPKRDDRPARRVGDRYPFSKQGWARQWRKALKDAGIEDYRFHDNRHTAATRNLRATGNLKGVQKLLGHADVRTTARYAHALEDDVRAMLFATESRPCPEPGTGEASETRRKAGISDD
jgi:integrase